MSQKSLQESNKGTTNESTEEKLPYLRCPVKGHNRLELKFVSKKEFPNISRLYCPICLSEVSRTTNLKKLELVSLEDIFHEALNISHQYMEKLEPVITNLQQKQKQITKSDFKSMFQNVMSRRDKFRKVLQNFKADIAFMCQKYEELFEKQLESQFHESFFTIDSNLTSFKDTIEILRLRLGSYRQDLCRALQASNNSVAYCQSVSNVLKDFQSLETSNLLSVVNRALQENPSNSKAVEKFNNDTSIEKDLTDSLKKALNVLSDKIENLQKSLSDKARLQKELGVYKVPENFHVFPNSSSSKSIEQKEETKNSDLAKKKDDKSKVIWADPADESIEVFEKEIAKFYQGDLIKKLLESVARESGETTTEDKIEGELGQPDKPNDNISKPHETNIEENKENGPSDKANKEVKSEKVEEESKGNNTEVENVSKNDQEEELVEENDEGSDDENYFSEEDYEEEDEKAAIERELARRLKNSVQPELLRKVFKSKKYPRQLERHMRQGLVKFSTIIEENVWPMEGKEEEGQDDKSHSISVVTVMNKDKTKEMRYLTTQKMLGAKGKDTKESKQSKGNNSKEKINMTFDGQKDPTALFLAQLKGQMPDEEVLLKLQKLVKDIKATSKAKNKRLGPENILDIQNFIGEFLRESHVKDVLEYRKKRRQFNDNDEALKYNYVCRDFFVKYYNHYKNIKSMFLEVIGLSKQTFNNDYKYWKDHDHNYLAWSRFKAKLQKASLSESKKALPVGDLKRILDQLLYFIKEPLGEFREDIVRTSKTERYLLVELLLARVFDRAYFTFQIEEEDILASLKANSGPAGKESHKLYEEFESIIAGLAYPGVKIQVTYETSSGSEKK